MIDAWQGPPPVSNQFPHNEPDGIRKLLGLIQGIKQELRESRSHLPGAGGISNAMLTSPVAPGILYTAAQGFSVTTTMTARASITVTCPEGFTEAAISAVGRVFAYNPNTTGGSNGAGADYLSVQTAIAGYYGYALPLSIGGSGGSNVGNGPFSTILPGLTPGDTFTVTVSAQSSFLGWAANASNTAEISGSILWLR